MAIHSSEVTHHLTAQSFRRLKDDCHIINKRHETVKTYCENMFASLGSTVPVNSIGCLRLVPRLALIRLIVFCKTWAMCGPICKVLDKAYSVTPFSETRRNKRLQTAKYSFFRRAKKCILVIYSFLGNSPASEF